MKTEEFNKLPKADQRIRIAKDALANLKAEKYIARTGNFIDLSLYELPKEGCEIQPLLNPKNIRSCYVCGLGALMVSAVRLKNSLKMPKDINFDDIEQSPENSKGFGKVLKKLFSKNQRQLIEAAFELDEGYYYYNYDISHNKAADFGRKYPDRTDRLVAILKNIITNKGTFKL